MIFYVNKIEKRITFKIKTEYYLELLTSKKWNYLEGLKLRLLKMKLVTMCLIWKWLTTFISKIEESCIHLFLINHLVNYYIFHQNVKVWTVNKVKNFLIAQKNMQKIHLKVLQKDSFKKQEKQLTICLVIALLIKSQKFQKI